MIKKYYVYQWPDPAFKKPRRTRFPATKEGEKERDTFAKDIFAKKADGIKTTCNETFGQWLLSYINTFCKQNK